MFEHILVPLDGSMLAEKVLPHVVTLAQSFGAQVTLLRAVERVSRSGRREAVDPLDWKMRKSEAEAYLEEIGTRLAKVDLETEQVVSEGDAAEQIISFARTQDVDLIALSSHGRSGLSEWNINSVVQKVILGAYVPVLIVRAYRPVAKDLTALSYDRVLVPLDGSQRAECVLSLAKGLGQSQGTKILLAHVIAEPDAPRRIAVTEEEQELMNRLMELNRHQAHEYIEGVESRLSVDVETYVIEGNPPTALRELIEDKGVRLVVLSAHGYSGETEWPYGSVALNFIAYGTTPLLIVQDISRKEIEETEAERAVQEQKGH